MASYHCIVSETRLLRLLANLPERFLIGAGESYLLAATSLPILVQF